MPVRAARNRALLIVFAALVCLMSALSQAANVTHTFDANGRLIRAESPNGDSAVYTYL